MKGDRQMKNTTENLVVIEKAKIDWCPRDSSIYRGSEHLIDGRMLLVFDPNEDADIIKQLSDNGCNVHQIHHNYPISSEIQVKNKLRLWVRTPIKDYKIPYSVLDKEELVEYFDFENGIEIIENSLSRYWLKMCATIRQHQLDRHEQLMNWMLF